MSLIIERDSSKFSKHILMMQQRKKLCDSDVIVNGEKIPVHSLILSASSEFFEQQFVDGDLKEVSLQNIDSKSFKNIIEYFYSGKIIIDKSNCNKILDVAHSLIIPEIIKGCSRFAEMWINVENCMDTWQFASMRYLPSLEESAYNYVCAYFEKASKTKGFLRLDYERMLKLLESDLNVSSESIVLSSVKRWINEDKPNRSNRTIKLLENVKLPYIPQNEILENFQSLCNIDTRCDRMMLEAIQWQTTTTKPIQTNLNTKPRSPHSALIVIGGNGTNQSKIMEVFDMKTKKWTAQPEIQFKASDFGCVLHEEKLIVVGGREGNTVTNLVQSYDPKTRTVSTMPSLLKARWLHNTVKLGKYVYAVGGRNTNDGGNINDIERWDFVSNKWENIASFSKVKDRFKAAVLGNEIFCIGGNINSVHFKDTDAYCPETGKWRECGKLNIARVAFGITSFGGYLYVAGGAHTEHLNSVEKYDPNIDQWIIFQNFDLPRAWLAIGDCWGSLIIIAGYSSKGYESKVQIFNEEKLEWTEIGSINIARSNNIIMQIPWKFLY